ncbi:MAG: metal ABC transporter substrate-binding protein [Polaromonas sp.]|nr:metal ABC transporter substrate-binding protein [Polaromonas sp.]
MKLVSRPFFHALMGLVIGSAALLTGHSFAADKIAVTASFSILADLVRVVGGERVNVTHLVGPNEDAHVFEAKPSDAKALLQSRLLVSNGLGFDPWAQKLAKSVGYQGLVVVASKGIKPIEQVAKLGAIGHGHGHANGEADPHAWQNPNNVVLYIRNITAALSQLDPASASAFQVNAAAYVKELQALDVWAKAQFSAVPAAQRKVITSHDAFGYLASHYQITFLSPQGISTEAQPSARDVARLISQIQREKIRAVFLENISNQRLLAQLSQDAGVTVGTKLYADALSNSDQAGATYLLMMRHNVSQLAAGMRLN